MVSASLGNMMSSVWPVLAAAWTRRATAALRLKPRRPLLLAAIAVVPNASPIILRVRCGAGAQTQAWSRRPWLVIVLDEFASLVRDLPGFVAGLVGIAQRGRSLGIHLIDAPRAAQISRVGPPGRRATRPGARARLVSASCPVSEVPGD